MLAGPFLLGLLLCGTRQAEPEAGFEQRYLWTWDHRMDWAGETPGGIVMGGGGSYRKPAGEYLEDYKALIDYVSSHTSFNAIIIWGLLRDTHGGIEAAQELCEYANEHGIRIVPGVGTSGYEGYYFEGDHRYNISTWLKDHPELRAVTQDGTPHNALCPSKPENVEWLQAGCRWLFETFAIGGINFEIGDFLVCYCEDCKRARAAIAGDAPDYYKDMAISTAPVARLAREIAPDAWLSYATYTGFTPDMVETPPSWVGLIPPGIICQWTLTGMGSDAKWPPGVRPPTELNTGYLHWGNKSTHSVHTFFVRRIQDICRRAAEAGFLGLATYGEDPASVFSMRVFYDAWSYFLGNPSASLEDYATTSLAEWFGSPESGREALAIFLDLENRGVDRASIPDAMEAARAARARAEGPRAEAAWNELADYLDARLKQIEAEDRIIEDEAAVAEAMGAGFRITQGTTTTLVLEQQAAEVLELKVRMDFNMEDGILPVMRVALNGEVLGPDRAIDRPETIRTPHHEGYQSLAAFDPDKQAWRVKYDTDFEINEVTGLKYDTLDYSPVFRFRVGDLWQDGENRLTIENLERRFRPTDHGVMVIGHIRLE
jgi:hypothetical protein